MILEISSALMSMSDALVQTLFQALQLIDDAAVENRAADPGHQPAHESGINTRRQPHGAAGCTRQALFDRLRLAVAERFGGGHFCPDDVLMIHEPLAERL